MFYGRGRKWGNQKLNHAVGARLSLLIHDSFYWKNGWRNARAQFIRRLGSISRHCRTSSFRLGHSPKIYSLVFIEWMFYQCYSSRSASPSWIAPSRKSRRSPPGEVLFIIHCGKRPQFFSIISRCSTSECVPKSNYPEINSAAMHPTDQTSAISFQSQHCRITSGGRYCLVQMMVLWGSSYLVAPPKSISLILLLLGSQYSSTLVVSRIRSYF